MVVFLDVVKLIRNYRAKERLMMESIRLGVEYRALTRPSFKFLLSLKQTLDLSAVPWTQVECGGAT